MLQEESGSCVNSLPLVALGSNSDTSSGGPRAIVEAAITALDRAGLRVTATSHLYATPCFPKGFGPDFVNAAVQLDSRLPAGEILGILHATEAAFGRQRQRRWGPRTLDLDLIAVGQDILPDEATQRHWAGLPLQAQARAAPDQLIVPHPRLQERAFVLVPLADIAPGWTHPLTGRNVTQMLAALPPAEISAIRRL